MPSAASFLGELAGELGVLRDLHHRHDQVVAVEGEAPHDFAGGRRSGDARRGHGRHAQGPTDLEGGLQLPGEILIEQAHHDRQVGAQTLRVESDLHVHDVLRRGDDQRPRLENSEPPQDVGIPRIGDLHRHSGGARGLDALVVTGERHHLDLLSQTMQQLDDPVADDAQTADDEVTLHSVRSPAFVLETPAQSSRRRSGQVAAHVVPANTVDRLPACERRGK
jgi:hypothetical protein